jgi:hypothetical protein
MFHMKTFQFAICTVLIVCSVCQMSAQLPPMFGSDQKTNDSSNTRPVNEAPTTNN